MIISAVVVINVIATNAGSVLYSLGFNIEIRNRERVREETMVWITPKKNTILKFFKRICLTGGICSGAEIKKKTHEDTEKKSLLYTHPLMGVSKPM